MYAMYGVVFEILLRVTPSLGEIHSRNQHFRLFLNDIKHLTAYNAHT